MKLLIVAPEYSGTDYIPGNQADREALTELFPGATVRTWDQYNDPEPGIWLYSELVDDSRFVIYLSGHGTPKGLRIPLFEKGGGFSSILSEESQKEGLLEYRGISALLATLPKGVDVLLLLDCCFGGEIRLCHRYVPGEGFGSPKSGKVVNRSNYYHYIAAEAIAIAASDNESESFASVKGSVFTQSLKKILRKQPDDFETLSKLLKTEYNHDSPVNITLTHKHISGLWNWVFGKPEYLITPTGIYSRPETKVTRKQKECPAPLLSLLALKIKSGFPWTDPISTSTDLSMFSRAESMISTPT